MKKEIINAFDIKSSEYPEIYDDDYSTNNLIHQEKRVRSRIVERRAIRYLYPLKNRGVVLDVGCGTGDLLLNIKNNCQEAMMHGVDISPKMIAIARQKAEECGYKNIYFIEGDLKKITFHSNIVISIGVIDYQEHPQNFLIELSRLVCKDGYLMFSTSNGDSLLRRVRVFLSKVHTVLFNKTKRGGLKARPIKEAHLHNLLLQHGYTREKRFFITFGIGLFNSQMECYLDRVLAKYLSNNIFGKYLSLSVIYVYKKSY